MFSFAKPTAGAVAVVALLAVGVLAPAAQAGSSASPQLVAQASTTTPAPSTTQKAPPATRAKKKPVDRVEARITELHSRLKITDAQATQWNAFAGVMRDNAKSMTDALDKRAAAAKTATAVEDMRSYQAVTQANADGMAKLVPAFENLYNAMSPEQQKNADVVFGSFAQRTAARHHSKKMPAAAPAKP